MERFFFRGKTTVGQVVLVVTVAKQRLVEVQAPQAEDLQRIKAGLVAVLSDPTQRLCSGSKPGSAWI